MHRRLALDVQHRVADAQRASAKAGDRAARLERIAGHVGAVEKLQPIAERIVDDNQILDEALVGERTRTARDFRARSFELRGNRIERGSVGNLPAEKGDTLPTASVDDDALLAVVHAEGPVMALVDLLKTEQTTSIFRPVLDDFGADTDITQGLNPGLSRHERSSRRKTGIYRSLILGLKQIRQRNQRRGAPQ